MEELGDADAPIPDADAIAEAEQGCNEVRARIEALGAVNAAAMEEYEEAQQRQEFLSAQRQDLIDSIRDTEKAIQEIDQVSRHKFAEAFEAINANFRAVVPDALRRRHGRDAPHRSGKHRRIRASISSARLRASGCRTCSCSRAERRRWPRWRC